MKKSGLKSSGCVMREKGWYKDGQFLGKTVTKARQELAKHKPKRGRK